MTYRVDCPECESNAVVSEHSGSTSIECENCEYLEHRSMKR